MRIPAKVIQILTLSLFIALGCSMATSEQGEPEKELGARQVQGAISTNLCVAVDEAVLPAIAEGQTRLVIVVSEFHPPSSGQANLVVELGGRERILGMYPQEAFDRADVEEHRRFLLEKPPPALSLEPGSPLCIRAKLTSSDGTGSALLHLETWTPPE